MPVNDRYPLADVLALCRRHGERTNRRVFVEYVMLAGVNDAPAQAPAARALLGPRRVQGQPHPLQPDRDCFDGSSRDAIAAFKAELDRARTRDRAPHPRTRHRRRVRAARH